MRGGRPFDWCGCKSVSLFECDGLRTDLEVQQQKDGSDWRRCKEKMDMLMCRLMWRKARAKKLGQSSFLELSGYSTVYLDHLIYGLGLKEWDLGNERFHHKNLALSILQVSMVFSGFNCSPISCGGLGCVGATWRISTST